MVAEEVVHRNPSPSGRNPLSQGQVSAFRPAEAPFADPYLAGYIVPA
jgi:hypothetical protein